MDRRIKTQYELAKLLYRTFRDDHGFAQADPALQYDPNHAKAEERIKLEPSVYWRQGIVWGRLDDALDALTPPDEKGGRQLMGYGRFEAAFVSEEEFREKFRKAGLLFLRFHPHTRPVLWRMLVTQAHLYEALLAAHASTDAQGEPVSIIPTLTSNTFEWRNHMIEADDDYVLKTPLLIAQEYLRTHLTSARQKRQEHK